MHPPPLSFLLNYGRQNARSKWSFSHGLSSPTGTSLGTFYKEKGGRARADVRCAFRRLNPTRTCSSTMPLHQPSGMNYPWFMAFLTRPFFLYRMLSIGGARRILPGAHYLFSPAGSYGSDAIHAFFRTLGGPSIPSSSQSRAICPPLINHGLICFLYFVFLVLIRTMRVFLEVFGMLFCLWWFNSFQYSFWSIPWMRNMSC